MSKLKKLTSCALLNCLIVSSSLMISPFVSAQQSGGNNQTQKGNPLPASTPIKDKISLPDVPDYPGRLKLVSGESYPASASGGGKSYALNYAVSDSASRVSGWYADSLKSNGWTVNTSPTTGAIRATNDKGALCIISVESNTATGGCSIDMSYSTGEE